MKVCVLLFVFVLVVLFVCVWFVQCCFCVCEELSG